MLNKQDENMPSEGLFEEGVCKSFLQKINFGIQEAYHSK